MHNYTDYWLSQWLYNVYSWQIHFLLESCMNVYRCIPLAFGVIELKVVMGYYIVSSQHFLGGNENTTKILRHILQKSFYPLVKSDL